MSKKKKKNFENEFIKEAFNYEGSSSSNNTVIDLEEEEEKEADEYIKKIAEEDNDVEIHTEENGESVAVDEDEDGVQTVEEKAPVKKVNNNDLVRSVIREDSKAESSGKGFNIFVNFFTLITMVVALVYFVLIIIDMNSSLVTLINTSILAVFSIIYLVVCLTYRKKKKIPMLITSLLLCAYFSINIFQHFNGVNIVPAGGVADLSGKSVVDAVEWANKNKVKITQVYEYSDMVPEFEIISQSVKSGTSLKDVDEIVISISEGPNPYKEIVVPSMLTWDSERVINFIKMNYLENVVIEFVESDQVKDTVIEQSMSGNLRRNDELKLTFSYGDTGIAEEVTLIDFTKMSKFEIEFFMKQHKLNYNFEEEFSNKIKKGYGLSQSNKAGEVVNIYEKNIIVTISKGPKIVIPELKNMSATELTDWAVKNKLKLEFIDQYDDSVKMGNVISIDKNKGDVVEQGSTIKVTLSLGSLKMPDFKDIDKFYEWADKFGIKYEIRHEFSDVVEAGGIISFSYKKGETLKNDEAIVVVISDGAKKKVPKLTGLTKKQAAAKLDDLGLKYNFVYKNSSTTKDTVLSQSISAGSEVSKGTTITVTLSSGKKESSSNSPGNSSGSSSSNPTPSPSPSPEPSCEKVMVYIDAEFLSIGNPTTTCSKIKAAYPSLKFSCSYVKNDGLSSGMLANSGDIDGVEFSTCDTITLNIVKND